MQIQRITRKDGVKRRRVPGVGATPVRCTCRVGSAALVAPTPGNGTYQPWTESGARFSPGQYQVGSSSGTLLDRNKYQNKSTSSTCKGPEQARRLCRHNSQRGRECGRKGIDR